MVRRAADDFHAGVGSPRLDGLEPLGLNGRGHDKLKLESLYFVAEVRSGGQKFEVGGGCQTLVRALALLAAANAHTGVFSPRQRTGLS